MDIISQKEQNQQELFPENCQSLYFNGFSMAIGMGDVIIALQLNGKPNIILNTSYTVAKTLAEGLTKLIQNLEQKTNTNIMTTQTIAQALSDEEETK